MFLTVAWVALLSWLHLGSRGEIVRGLPCIKRHNQLYCRTGGTHYPKEKIEKFIDDNKALMRRMYGEVLVNVGFEGSLTRLARSAPYDFSFDFDAKNASGKGGNSFFQAMRNKRQTNIAGVTASSNREDACESMEEIAHPYWASNGSGNLRAIVNTDAFSQPIAQEICTKTTTRRCGGECGCEQKYKWHRLLAFDPEDDCKGIFIDWFLFPSCCVCRCDPF